MTNRRALSSVVGMVFAIIALTATIAYVSFSMNTLSQYNNAVLNQNQVSLNSGKERFAITSVTIPNSKFNITVANTGNLPINFTKIWVQNTTSPDWMKNYVPSNGFVAPGGTLKNIGQSIPGVMYTTKAYYVKLVTSRGNTQAFTVNSANTAPLNIQLFAYPSVVPSGFKTEIVMAVTNNGSSTLVNLTPNSPPTCTTVSGSPSCSFGSVSPPSSSTLQPGSTAYFKWDLTLTGGNGDTATVTASLQNGFAGNTASVNVSVQQVTASSSNWSQTFGAISMNYSSLQWSSNAGVTWNVAFVVPHGTAVVWKVDITNNDPKNRVYYINGNTTFFEINTHSPGTSQNWYICPDATCSSAYSPNSITIAASSTKTIYLGAVNAGGTGGTQSTTATANVQFAVFILVYGYFGSVVPNNFAGQEIPFHGLYQS